MTGFISVLFYLYVFRTVQGAMPVGIWCFVTQDASRKHYYLHEAFTLVSLCLVLVLCGGACVWNTWCFVPLVPDVVSGVFFLSVKQYNRSFL